MHNFLISRWHEFDAPTKVDFNILIKVDEKKFNTRKRKKGSTENAIINIKTLQFTKSTFSHLKFNYSSVV